MWRFDPEAKWFWLLCFLKGNDLQKDVAINLHDFKTGNTNGS